MKKIQVNEQTTSTSLICLRCGHSVFELDRKTNKSFCRACGKELDQKEFDYLKQTAVTKEDFLKVKKLIDQSWLGFMQTDKAVSLSHLSREKIVQIFKNYSAFNSMFGDDEK